MAAGHDVLQLQVDLLDMEDHFNVDSVDLKHHHLAIETLVPVISRVQIHKQLLSLLRVHCNLGAGNMLLL